MTELLGLLVSYSASWVSRADFYRRRVPTGALRRLAAPTLSGRGKRRPEQHTGWRHWHLQARTDNRQASIVIIAAVQSNSGRTSCNAARRRSDIEAI